MLRTNELILIMTLVLLRKKIARRLGPMVTELCWMLLAVRLLLPAEVSVKLTLPVQGKAMMERMGSGAFPSEWRWAGFTVLCMVMACMTAWFHWRVRHRTLCRESEIQNWIAAHPLVVSYGVFRSGGTTAPVSYGVFHLRILLPENDFTPEQRDLILLHEWTHLRRGDLWKKRLVLLAAFWNWYHPAVWLMVHFANRDMELCCDWQVVQGFTRREKQDYARLLLDFQTHTGLTRTGFTGGKLKERIVNLMTTPMAFSWKKIVGLIVAVAACAVVLYVRLVPQKTAVNLHDYYSEAEIKEIEKLTGSEEFYEQMQSGKEIVITLSNGKVLTMVPMEK